ncbi:response regulator [Catellatospora chokoriensis]|uniref:DNA-binding response regulator n=1 Tax=Catellatospora chokoriensis TaxID=310353 RepID=A0A8J3K0J4_9ACTN|nr:response regulator transcription factor [Catellatospora chokoriensis]GIF88278.1 DNA-binding response regulator [Catellatospora chokoriensis]
MTTAPIRVLIADDHFVVRRGVGAMLASLDDAFVVVAEATTGVEAVRQAQLTTPDVVIMDINMPVLNGIESTRQLGRVVPAAAVLVLTMFDDDETVLSAMRAGARGYLLKGALQDEMVAAIRSVAAGQVVIGPGVAGRLLSQLTAAQPADAPFPQLTSREREVLTGIAQGRGNGAIAAGLGLAPKTVGNHVSAIFAKLRVASRAEAIVRARESGLGGRTAEGS